MEFLPATDAFISSFVYWHNSFGVLWVSPVRHFCNFHGWIPAPSILSSEFDHILFPSLASCVEMRRHSLGQTFLLQLPGISVLLSTLVPGLWKMDVWHTSCEQTEVFAGVMAWYSCRGLGALTGLNSPEQPSPLGPPPSPATGPISAQPSVAVKLVIAVPVSSPLRGLPGFPRLTVDLPCDLLLTCWSPDRQ